ncbi:hypothetical protein ASPBRDRAFT_417979 [Aspergillus brasiliensis CBS 101740]|uniref:Chitin-binding type-1 domain-containing protein n=1 Tax=Aspergillus brasiliensis (strain CBS 101740 / IMI 381727 / IBT 21946) TaxID=767769 RepID=A0A1L9U492_ASPBC|nr:hypothetical protein ASPBRDRAFT_417979 [Aspergillus brasiliensis CBS 101740]
MRPQFRRKQNLHRHTVRELLFHQWVLWKTSGYTSTNGECGPNFEGNMTCPGSLFGDCCSVSGYCGNSTAYCEGSNCYSGACT